MEYFFEGLANIKFFGTPKIHVKKLYPSKFIAGEVVYSLKKARLGALEKICIKDINLNMKYNQPIFIYKDTFNAIYEENELCRLIQAKQEIEGFKNYFNKSVLSSGVLAKDNLLRSDNFENQYVDYTTDVEKIIDETKVEIVFLDGGSP